MSSTSSSFNKRGIAVLVAAALLVATWLLVSQFTSVNLPRITSPEKPAPVNAAPAEAAPGSKPIIVDAQYWLGVWEKDKPEFKRPS